MIEVLCLLLVNCLASEIVFDDGKCLGIPDGVCIDDGQKMNILSGDPQEAGLLGYWSFDDDSGLDYSVNQNPVSLIPRAGIGVLTGTSALLGVTSEINRIAHLSVYQTNAMTLSFWFYLLDDSRADRLDTFRSIVYKGERRNPEVAILLWPQTNRFLVRVGEAELTSSSSLLSGVWTHLTLVRDSRVVGLYVNGILDSEMVLDNPEIRQKDDLYLGATPWHTGVLSYMDELRYWGRALSKAELESFRLAFSDIPYHAANIRFACEGCGLGEAQAACRGGFQLCSGPLLEAHQALVVGYRMGWIKLHGGSLPNNLQLWTLEMTQNSSLPSSQLGVGICCKI